MCFWMGTRSPGTWTKRLGFCPAPSPRQEHSMGVCLWVCQVLLLKGPDQNNTAVASSGERAVNSTKIIEQHTSREGKRGKKKAPVRNSGAEPVSKVVLFLPSCCRQLPWISFSLMLVLVSLQWTGGPAEGCRTALLAKLSGWLYCIVNLPQHGGCCRLSQA